MARSRPPSTRRYGTELTENCTAGTWPAPTGDGGDRQTAATHRSATSALHSFVTTIGAAAVAGLTITVVALLIAIDIAVTALEQAVGAAVVTCSSIAVITLLVGFLDLPIATGLREARRAATVAGLGVPVVADLMCSSRAVATSLMFATPAAAFGSTAIIALFTRRAVQDTVVAQRLGAVGIAVGRRRAIITSLIDHDISISIPAEHCGAVFIAVLRIDPADVAILAGGGVDKLIAALGQRAVFIARIGVTTIIAGLLIVRCIRGVVEGFGVIEPVATHRARAIRVTALCIDTAFITDLPRCPIQLGIATFDHRAVDVALGGFATGVALLANHRVHDGITAHLQRQAISAASISIDFIAVVAHFPLVSNIIRAR